MWKKTLVGSITSLLLLLGWIPAPAHAELPYHTMTNDMNGGWIPSPNAFAPDTVWDGFLTPEDLFITPENEIYVAETGNDRIVRLNARGEVTGTYPVPLAEGEEESERDPKEKLRRPEGVFVADNGDVYVADTGSRRVAVFDREGTFLREYGRPDTELIPSTFIYSPSKVLVDRRGYLYIATKGGYQGLLQLAPDGSFAGFFGANKVPFDWLESWKRRFYTEEQLQEEQARLPGAITNLSIDADGFIYTVNRGLKQGQLKRLNYGGADLLADHNFAPWVGPLDRFDFVDVHADPNGVMTVVESAGGRVYQYDENGDLLFRFGNDSVGSQRLGVFMRSTSVVVDSNGMIYVADGELGVIQRFKRTEYGDLVHRAVALSMDGKHDEAAPLWEDVNRLNGMYDRAYYGMAKAAFKNGEYERAMDQFEHSSDKTGYSESFWQIRMNWLLEYFGPIMTGVLAIVAVWTAFRYWRKKKAGSRAKAFSLWSKLPESVSVPLRLSGRVLRQPVQVMYEVSDHPQVKWWFALLLLVAGFASKIAGLAVVSFTFSTVSFERVDLWAEALFYVLPWVSWVTANYLIGSVMKGEGSFSRVFYANSFAMVPYVLFTFPLQLLTNVLTQQEGVVYHTATNLVFLWVLILMFIATQTIHNYNLKETLGMVGVSLFTFGCLWVFGFVLVGLIYQAVDFFVEFGREVIERV